VHDGILFERAGKPAAAICTDLFTPTADATAKIQGIPGYRYAVVKHPTGRLPEEELRERVRVALPEVIEILLERSR
jgi:hypothetical protein